MRILCLLIFSATSSAVELQLDIEVPQLQVAEYHAPYVATWIEDDQRQAVIATSLWYDQQEKWLKDIRQWWRKTGRYQSQPYDGVTGATRRPGMHKLQLQDQEIAKTLSPGNYTLFIEAAREVGGREVLKIPFQWPITSAFKHTEQGTHELGTVTLSIQP